MIKICDKATVKPLSIIYKNCIDTGIFPDLWKKSKIHSPPQTEHVSGGNFFQNSSGGGGGQKGGRFNVQQ